MKVPKNSYAFFFEMYSVNIIIKLRIFGQCLTVLACVTVTKTPHHHLVAESLNCKIVF